MQHISPVGTMAEKGFKMTRHWVKRNDFRLKSGASVSIEYWADATSVHVAAFDADGNQASIAVYEASLDATEHLNTELEDALINSMANALEYDLMNNPDTYLRKS